MAGGAGVGHLSPPPPAGDHDAGLLRLDEQAWTVQFRDFEQAAAIGQQLVDASHSPAWRCRGWVHVGQARLRSAAPALAAQALQQALAVAAPLQDPLLDALCRDLQAMALSRDNRHAEALALLEPNLAMDESRRGSHASYGSANLAGPCCRRLGDVDRSLQLRYRALALAQALGDPALVANACANLGGLQTDLLSLDDALALSAQAVADRAGLQGSNLRLTSTFSFRGRGGWRAR